MKKILGFKRYREYYYRGIVDLPYFPLQIWIEPTNYCNLKCSICIHSKKDFKAPKGFMNMELYNKIIEQCSGKVHMISLFLGGESFLNKNIYEMIKIAKNANIKVRINTNGMLIDTAVSEKIVESGLDVLTFSFEGNNKDKYEKIRIGSNYEKVFSNIENFLRIRNKKEKPEVIIQNLIEDSEDIDMNIYKFLSEKYNVKIKWPVFHNFSGYIEKGIKTRKKIAFFPCSKPWESMAVAWDGKVVGCCLDMERKLILGDLNKEKILDIWNNKKFSSFRMNLVEKNLNDLCIGCDQNFKFTKDPFRNIFSRFYHGIMWKLLKVKK